MLVLWLHHIAFDSLRKRPAQIAHNNDNTRNGIVEITGKTKQIAAKQNTTIQKFTTIFFISSLPHKPDNKTQRKVCVVKRHPLYEMERVKGVEPSTF